MQCAWVILSSVACPGLQYCTNYLILLIIKCVWIFCTTCVWNIRYTKKWARYDQICILVFMYSILYSCQVLTKLLTFSTDFRKVLKISNFMKIRKWKPSCCMQLDSSRLLWPARATTKISLAAPRHPLAVPVGWVLLGRIYCLNQLTTAPSPIGRKHHNESQGTLYYQQRRKYKKANKVN